MSNQAFERKVEHLGGEVAQCTKSVSDLNRQIQCLRSSIASDLQDRKAREATSKLPQPIQRLRTRLSKFLEIGWMKWILLPVTLAQKSGVFGVAVAVIGLLSAYSSLKFDVSVDTLTSLDSATPTETSFLITNNSPFTIHNVFYYCTFVTPQTAGPFLASVTAVPVPTPSLRSRGHFSAYCQLPPLLQNPLPTGTYVEVNVMYTPAFAIWKKLVGGELFLLRYDRLNNAVWLPAGDLTSDLKDLKQRACPTCP